MSLKDISAKFSEQTLEQMVQKVRKDGKVKSWELDTCSQRGCSYLSEVSRLQIIGESMEGEFTVNALIKALPKSLSRRLTFRGAEFFSKETEFYEKIWPAFEELQRKHNIPEPFGDIPLCLATYEDGEHDFIAMEDLGTTGYRAADRQIGLDEAHSRLAFASLGKFHGLSHAMRALEPEKFRQLTSHMLDIYYAEEARSRYIKMTGMQIEVAKDALSKEYPGTEIEEKFALFVDNTKDFYTRMIELTHTVNEYAVISHGDCWLPNFMFNYGPGERPEQIKLIDFQLVRLCSGALDISFMLYSCTTDELRSSHYEQMLRWYYEGIEHTLTQFNLDASKVFSFDTMKQEMKSFGRFGAGVAIESLPLSIMDDDETTDMEKIEGDRPLDISEIWVVKPIKTKEGRRRLADVFKHAVEQGYL